MDIFNPVLATRLVFILGITNLILVVMLSSTCRCLPASRLGAGLMKYGWYRQYYKYHCYLWYLLGISVTTHIVFAVGLVGVPF